MDRKILGLVIALIVGLVCYFFWEACVVPLKLISQKEIVSEKIFSPGKKTSKAETDNDLIYLYFDDWDIRSVKGKSVQIPTKLTANKSVNIKISLHQESSLDMGIRFVEIAFSVNTNIYPATDGENSWSDTGRSDAHEYRYSINETVPEGSEMALPDLDVTFRTAGIYDVHYLIMLENYESIEGKFIFKVIEG